MKAPIKGFVLADYPKGHVTQWFGENPQLYGAAWMRNKMKGHNGIDIVAPKGTPIYAVESGVVSQVKDNVNDGYGMHVRIKTFPVDRVSRVWVYGHLDTITCKLDQYVEEGTQIGTMGNTGFVISGATPYWNTNPHAGVHLHLGVRNMKDGEVMDYDNGYFGHYDFKHLLVEDNLKQQVSLLKKVVELYKQLIQQHGDTKK